MSVEEKEKTQPPSPRLGLDADHIKSKKERDPEADPSPTSDERSLTQVDSHDDLAPGDGDVPRDEHFKVGWDGPNDPDNPQNWSRQKRWYLTMVSGLLVLNATFASSAPSGIASNLIDHFHISQEVATLLISLFVAGYCVGPLLWGPLSEQYGRLPVFLIGFGVYTCFQVGCALAPNTASILIFRFLGGCFAASPLTTSGALIGDIWDASTRGKALAMFTLAPFAGPALGPVVGGYISVAGADWRWLFWVLAIFAGLCFVLIVFTLPETYAPVILAKRAAKLRKSTGDQRWFAEIERSHVHWQTRVENILAKPFKILFTESMLMAITLYMSFVYGCIYLLFEAYPIVYTEGHHMNAGASGLMFLPLFLGGAIGVAIYLLIFNPQYERLIKQYAPERVPPEHRLTMAIWAGPPFVISFFWFGWTSYPSIPFWAPLFSGGALGISVVLIFLALFNYILDAYLIVAASALASNTVVRSAFGAGFPLFAFQMYDKLNPRWASTLLGCIALILAPIPAVLIKVGPHLRRKSKYAPTKD